MTPTPKQPKRVPLWRIRREFKRVWDAINAQRPNYGGPLHEVPSGGFAVSRSKGGSTYIPPFHPTVSAQSSGNNQDISIGTGWFNLPSDTADGRTVTTPGTIPSRNFWPFKPKIGLVEIDDNTSGSVPTDTLVAGEENQVWATWGMDQVDVLIGATNHGTTAGAGLTMESETTSSAGETNDVTVQPLGVATLKEKSYVFDPTESITIKVYNSTTTPANKPNYDGNTTYSFYMGKYTLNSDGSVDDANSEWYVKENITPTFVTHIHSVYSGAGGDDTSSNPTISS